VDIQSAALTRSVTSETFKELPSGGSWIQMAAIVPAIRAQNTDVGGVLGDQVGAQVSAHGALPGDGVSMIDGLRIGNMYISSNLTNMSLSPLLFDQVDIQLSGQSGETGTNGVIMNAIPRAGGNRFSGSALVNGSGPGLQGSNVTSDLNARGLQGASTTLKTLYDINGAVGGPIKQDKVWFYATSRYFTNEFYLASRFYATDASAVRRTEDLGNQAYGGTYTYDNNGRVTWAINEKQKFSGWYAFQYKVDPHWLIAPPFNPSPEAARITTWHTQLSTFKWTYTATNKLLFEAGMAAGASPDTIKLDPDQVGICPAQGTLAPRCISITLQNVGNLVYRAPTGFDFDDRLPSQSFNASASYVTGSHNAKFGFDMQRGHFWRGDNNDSTGGIWYTANRNADGSISPALITIQSPASGWQNNLNYNLGLFVQDRWTLDRLTLTGGLRVDFLNESTEAFTATAHRWLPNRNQAYGEVKNVPNWKDINPRASVAYDLFGNGKTALKGSFSRGVEQDSIRYAAANNPASTLVTQTARAWTDGNNNFTPDCNLSSGAAQDNLATGGDLCGAWLTPNFGSNNVATIFSPSIMEGWGVRPYNYEFSAGIQQELLPRVSASVGYFSRVYGNFMVQDNENLSRADFTEYSIVVPTDARLPNSGQTVRGIYDPNILVGARNVIKSADDFGKQQHHWNGVDFSVDARMRNGLFLQAGLSTGKQMTDNCEIIDDLPEALTLGNIAGVLPAAVQGAAAGSITPASFCHQESPYLTQYKGLMSYTLPWYGVRVSGTLQSLPGPQILATNIYNNANRATLTTLARPFTLAQSTISTIAPGSEYGDRLNQIDLRFTKIVNVGRGRIDLNVDIYNAFNSDAVLSELGTIGPVWRLPTNVIQPRFVKFGARWDF
jgi:hypothetical protein